MLNNQTRECFGGWCFEDQTCMTCIDETICKVSKEDKEREYKRSIKDKRCYDCIDIIKCHKQIKNCFGNLTRDCNTFRCKCSIECELVSFKEIKVKCIKPVEMKTEYYESHKFEKGKEYTLYCTDYGLLSIDKSSCGAVLGRKEHYRLGDIFDKYFIKFTKSINTLL